jgi:hypothetical protein
LSWKTRSENAADTIEHGTSKRGERNHFAKISQEDAEHILALRGRMSQSAIARIFGVTQPTISDIQRGKSWGWLER